MQLHTSKVSIVALAAGCATPTPSQPPIAAAPVAAARTDDDDAPSPRVRAGMAAPSRDAWPCALVSEDGADVGTRTVFRYGARDACWIPRALAASGVYGCPERIEHTATEGAAATQTVEYDDDGRLIALRGDVTRRYAWDGDRLAAVTREHGSFDRASYRDEGPAIVAVDEHGAARERLTLEGERLVQRVETFGERSTTAVLQWADGRPATLHDGVARRFVYQCSPEMLRDSAAGVPPPAAAIASLPLDARLERWDAVLAHHRRDCSAFAARPCELVADFDADGKADRAVKLRERGGARRGIAIRWGSGGVSILGAGVATRQLHTDVHLEGVDLSWSAVEPDFDFIARWRVVPRSPSGFFRAGPRRAVGGGDESPAPEATGDGILIDSGDVAEVIYWDGVRWRVLVLGY
ncbi:MAG: hypothetical protein U0168_27810 [Nannocystaceae bacterium]